MQFYRGMSCCNPHRESVGLACDLGHQYACANNELLRLAEHSPASVPTFISTLLKTFPDCPDWILVSARRVERLDDFVERSARFCAALATKTERQTFTTRISGHLNGDQLDQFKKMMSSEWRRLRFKDQGDPK